MDQAMRLAMPGRGSYYDSRPVDDIDDVFDETAIVATQEFASRLQSGLTPNFSRWAEFKAGDAIPDNEKPEVDLQLGAVTREVFNVLDQSNFGQEVYEAYLDLSVSLGCMEVLPGTATSPVMFNAVPITQLWVDSGPFDRIDKFFRLKQYSFDSFKTKYPNHKLDAEQEKKFRESNRPIAMLEATMRDWSEPNDEVWHKCVLWDQEQKIVFHETYRGIGSCPIFAFRWSKAAGEVWGHGPLMNALPAIKTCNMVVQMVLENAQMAISGMYNLDDDGTVNVDTIQLVPGTIIPRVPGSQGLSPVPSAGDFNVANLVLEEMRANIKRSLYNDMLGNPNRTPMSATEVAERMADLSRQIGAAFGRLQAELVNPLLQRVVYILKQQGRLELPAINGQMVKLAAVSPLAQAQAMQDIQQVDRLVEFVQTRFGPQLANVFMKGEDIAGYVADKLQVPKDLVRSKPEMQQMIQAVQQMAAQASMGAEDGEAAGPPSIQ